MDAQYTFQITTQASLTVYSRILVKFPQWFPQRINHIDGSFTCFINAINAFCKIMSTRKIAVQMPISISASSTIATTFSLTVTGVS